jgi:DNA-binding transcriptional LysR family regulator
MMIERMDVGNLVALHVLLEERNVTRAAERLGITQSSMSHRLARLRETLEDPLFLRAPAGLVPTSRAEQLAAPLAQALRVLHDVVVPPIRFDPKVSAYSLSIAMPDLLAPIAPRLVSSITSAAPAFQVKLMNVLPGLSSRLSLGAPGLALVPSRFVEGGVIARPLGEVRFGVVGRRGHPALKTPLTVDRWLSYAHVVVRTGNERTGLVEEELGRRRLVRRVGLEVPSFLAGLLALTRSDLLMNVPVPIVLDAAKELRLGVRDLPITLPPLRFAMCWHERFRNDGAHAWARERVFAAVRPSFE